jgi:uncharacterized protein YjbJ (UPF0337 family)
MPHPVEAVVLAGNKSLHRALLWRPVALSPSPCSTGQSGRSRHTLTVLRLFLEIGIGGFRRGDPWNLSDDRGFSANPALQDKTKSKRQNWDRVEGNWKEFKGKAPAEVRQAHERRSRCRQGKRTELSGSPPAALRLRKDRAEKEIDDWLAPRTNVVDVLMIGVAPQHPRWPPRIISLRTLRV